MSEAAPATFPNPPPLTIPQKRPLTEDKHAPTVGSPLNPNSTRVREERMKKPSAKARKESPEPTSAKKGGKKTAKVSEVLRPIRYKLPLPKITDFEPPPRPFFVPGPVRKGREFAEATEIITNKKGFRYTNAIADPRFKHSLYNRHTEPEPYGARLSYEDASAQILFDGNAVTTDKGFRMGRANVGAREGRWYWECKILSGIQQPNDSGVVSEDGGHVRIGWARREATLEGPVGFDAYSYGLRDVGGQKITRSRPNDFALSDLCEGDVIGLELTLPSLSFHRKVVDGVYNKAVDSSDDLDLTASAEAPDIVRDRVVLRSKTRLYFEAYEYQYTKPLEDYMNPTPLPASAASEVDPPNPNNPLPQLRTLPFSSIKIYRNGELLGTPFTDLLSFLPPASKPNAQVGAREGLDDGMLGYYPAVSVFRGGAVETNFGPDFTFPPEELSKKEDVEMSGMAENDDHIRITGSKSKLRPMSERFDEQIAEDIVYDIIDEVDFWALDGGDSEGAMKDLSEAAPATFGSVEIEAGVAMAMEGRKPAPLEVIQS